MKFFNKDFLSVDLVIFNEENLNEKLHFLCSGGKNRPVFGNAYKHSQWNLFWKENITAHIENISDLDKTHKEKNNNKCFDKMAAFISEKVMVKINKNVLKLL